MAQEKDSTDQPILLSTEVPVGIYRHYKTGKDYQLIGRAIHTETKELMAVYKALYEPFQLFVRPYTMFFEQVNGEPRFRRML